MDGFIPVGAASATPTLVQSRTFLPGPGAPLTQSVSFLSAVAAGNLLIVMVTTRSSDGSGFSVPTGWTELSVIDANGFNGGSAFIGYRVADGTEGTGPFGFGTSSGTQRRIVIAEFNGVTEFVDRSQVDAHAATSALALGSVTPSPATPALLLAGAINGGTITAINTGYTNISAGFVEGGVNGPYSRLAYKAEASASGSYSATTAQSSAFECAGDHIAFSGDPAAISWVAAPDTVDDNDATSDDVDVIAVASTSGVFWRGDLGTGLTIGELVARVGFTDNDDVTVLVQAGDASDWSDAATIVQVDFEATGGLTADEIVIAWDGEEHRYWQLVLDTTAQDLRVFEVALTVSEVVVPAAGKAILEIYVHDEDASRWGTATWATGPATGDEGVWSGAGWQDVTPQGVNAHIIWGSRRPSRGILAEQSPASWNVETYDPDRILDPGNFDGPFYPQLVAGVPIRISHDSLVIRTGIVDEWHYKLKSPDYQGQILASDSWSLINQAMVPPDSILGNTLYGRIRDAIDAAGIAVGGIPVKPRDGPIGPTIADWVEGAPTDDATSVGEHVRIASEEVLWVPLIQADGSLGLRSWGVPLDRGREIGAPNLEDLEAVSHEDGTYSVVKVQVEDPDADPIIRKAAPMPRYGERVWERREPTIDPEGYAAAILAERPWPGVQWVPGAIHCFSHADVNYFGSIEIMERVTLSVPGAVSVQGRVLGGELFVEHRARDTKGAKWLFYFAVATDGATAIGSTILVADGTGETLLDDMTETDFLEAD